MYAPSSVKVVFRGSEQTAMIGMIFLCMSKMCHINTGYREHALNMECNYIILCIKYMSVRTDNNAQCLCGYTSKILVGNI